MAGRALSWISSSWKVARSPLLFRAVRNASSLKHEGIEVTLTDTRKSKPDSDKLVFGKSFTDHMLLVNWSVEGGWERPRIVPYGDLTLSPATSALHYATECFEGMKAYHGMDGRVRLFRPMENMKRLNVSAHASSLPEFDGEEFVECIKDLIRIDRDWVPKQKNCSLYVRPTYIGTQPYLGVAPSGSALLYCILCPVGPYFSTGTFNPVSLYADPEFVRAWPGGAGASKMGGNYGPTIRIQKVAESKGCNQVLWLLGDNQEVTEVGTMNVFVHWINENGKPEIATPPLTGTILPGVTRKSLLELAKDWGTHEVVERKFTMEDIRNAVNEKRLLEMFGAGTACVVCPISRILHVNENINIPTMDTGAEVAKRFYQELTDIQYGVTEHKWSIPIE